jgi:hypothetical protein
MANYVFKQFCSDLDSQSLNNLIEIVSTPNDRATDMVNGDDESDDGSQDGEEAYGSEVSDDSDNM